MSISTTLVRAALAGSFVLGALAQEPSPPEPAKGTSRAIQERARPPVRITIFSATPEAIQAGQAVTLQWATENPNGVSIDPGIGRVTSRGSMQTSPATTTTYTLTVRGADNTTLTKSVTVKVAGTAAARASAAAATPPPDLSGVYNSGSINPRAPGGNPRAPGGNPRAPAGGGQNNAIAAVLRPGAEQFKVVRGPDDTGQYADCMPTGVPLAYFVPYQWEIVQGADHIVILYEYPGIFRIIPTNVAAHQADLDPTWMGDSIGHWEGQTLVVDTIGFNDKTELPGGFKHTEALHVVERFTRIDRDNLQWEAVVEDPNVFQAPWKISRTFPLRPELNKVDEFVCENNRNYRPLFKK
jgi:hypothetical protein